MDIVVVELSAEGAVWPAGAGVNRTASGSWLASGNVGYDTQVGMAEMRTWVGNSRGPALQQARAQTQCDER